MSINKEFFEILGIKSDVTALDRSCICIALKKEGIEPTMENQNKFIEGNYKYPQLTLEQRDALEQLIIDYFEEEGGEQFLTIGNDSYTVYQYLIGKPAYEDFYVIAETRNEALQSLILKLIKANILTVEQVNEAIEVKS